MINESLEEVLLDLLVDGPSSVAGLYGTLVHYCGYPRNLDVSQLINALSEMERWGWVRATQMADDGSFHEPTAAEREHDLTEYRTWLPRAEFQQLSVDEIGLWYEITTQGRTEWRGWLPDDGQHSHAQWMIDDLKDRNTVSVCAESAETADSALRWWLAHNRGVELVNASRCIEPIKAFKLRDGTVVTDGVRLTYGYRTSL